MKRHGPSTLRRVLLMAIFAFIIGLALGIKSVTFGETPGATRPAPSSALILYDAPRDEPKLGLAYAMMLQAVLGHFELHTEIRPITGYTAGAISPFSAIFYLGSYYNNPLPDDFLRDVAKTEKTVVWFKYNLWQISTPDELGFSHEKGMRFLSLQGLDHAPATENPGFFDTILYKGKTLKKYYRYDPKTQDVETDPDVGIVKIERTDRAQVRVLMRDSVNHAEAPYIVQAGASGNFWYFADIPLSYIGPRDRYLVLCDILHDILKIDHPEDHRALVRLEDVSAKVEFSSMKTLSDYLHASKIPFSIAVIPKYVDPLGAGNDGIPESISMDSATELKRALRYAIAEGGSVIMHGYTHQYDDKKNPNSGMSADDYEFWDAVNDSPVKEDSENWALNRLNAGVRTLSAHRLAPWAWETPHYQASPLAYRAMAKRFKTSYQRMVYYTSTKPDLHALPPGRDYAAGIFFPFMIPKDGFGNPIIPENLGNIEYDIHEMDPSSNVVYSWQDILENAEDALIVRDGFASFFFHPFWLDPDFENLRAFDDFKKTIEGITRLGFRWVDARTLISKPDLPLGHD